MEIAFLIVAGSVLVVFYGSLFREPKLISTIENRNLVQYPTVSTQNFISGSFQETLENAIGDQSIGSGKIKKLFKEIKSIFNSYQKNIITIVIPSTCDHYQVLLDEYYTFGCGDYIITKPKDYNIYIENIKLLGANYNEYLNTHDVFIYYIPSNRSIYFDNVKKQVLLENEIKNSFHYVDFSRLNVNNYEDYKKYFYKTDHHWKKEGQYAAYMDIVKMMLGNKEELIPISNTEEFEVDFFGSYSRINSFYKIKEKFSVYVYDIPKYKSYINKKEMEYGYKTKYFNIEYSLDKNTNHYSAYYGGDFAEIIYDFDNEKKENLLILSSSFSNAINDLIASHFNKTFVIDLRHYFRTFNYNFLPSDYISKNKIDKVLIVGDIYYYGMKDFMIKENE